MREAPERERTIGIARYVTDESGIGGRLRTEPADFRVREIEGVDPVGTDADPGSYPHLLVRVTLREWDTNDFGSELSSRLGASRERISWAGTKDKHAETTQLFSIRDVTPEELPTIADATITPVGRLGRPLSFGDLAGNAFRIRVRDTEGDPGPITEDLRTWWREDEPAGVGRAGGADSESDSPAGATLVTDAVSATVGEPSAGTGDEPRTATADEPTTTTADEPRTATGDGPTDDEGSRVVVPNWYGHQRFGSRRPVTHTVGLRIAAGDPRGAVLAYTGSPDEREPDDSQRAREIVDAEAERATPDWQRAREAMPGRLRFECAMLDRLVEWEATDSGTATDSEPTDSGATGGTDSNAAGGSDPIPTGRDDGSEPFDSKWWAALAAVPANLGRLFVNAAQSYLFNEILSERLCRGLPFARPVVGDVVCFRDDEDRVARPDPGRTQRATSERLSVLERHCERGRAFVTAPLIGHETALAEGEPGEIEREVLAAADVAPEDFALREPYDASGTRRGVLLGCDLSVDREAGDPVFRFALPSGAYATALLREYLQTDPGRL